MESSTWVTALLLRRWSCLSRDRNSFWGRGNDFQPDFCLVRDESLSSLGELHKASGDLPHSVPTLRIPQCHWKGPSSPPVFFTSSSLMLLPGNSRTYQNKILIKHLQGHIMISAESSFSSLRSVLNLCWQDVLTPWIKLHCTVNTRWRYNPSNANLSLS